MVRVFYGTIEAQLPGSADWCGEDFEGDTIGCGDIFEYRNGARRLVTVGEPSGLVL